jgi:signal-transduction protein with cAMP-binding, CBS, and nucleotidyltransferase domain
MQSKIVNAMKTHVPITHIMTSQVHTVAVNTSLAEVEHIMKKKHIRHIPIVEGGRILGMVSLTDLQRLSYTSSFAEVDAEAEDDVPIYNFLTLEQVMVRDPFCIQKTATVGDACDVLTRMDFHALPVVDGKELLGIVTTTDLLRYLSTSMG